MRAEEEAHQQRQSSAAAPRTSTVQAAGRGRDQDRKVLPAQDFRPDDPLLVGLVETPELNAAAARRRKEAAA